MSVSAGSRLFTLSPAASGGAGSHWGKAMASTSRRSGIGTFSLILRLVTALLVALLSVPVAAASFADDTGATDPAVAATDSPPDASAPADPAGSAPADPAPATTPSSTPSSAPAPAKSPVKSTVTSPVTSSTTTSSSTADTTATGTTCTSPQTGGKVTSFAQHTNEDIDQNPDPYEWINGNINVGKGPLHEGEYVPQRAIMSQLPLGTNKLVIQSQALWKGKHAYDFVPTPTLDDFPAQVGQETRNRAAGFVPRITGGSISSWDVVHSADVDTITVLFNATSSDVTLIWFAHIASELDWGIGTGAGSIDGSPYHNKLVSLNCASTGSQDNQIQAGAIHFATLRVAKDAQPNSPDDFHFTITPGGTASSFDLDDDSDPTLPNILPAPGFRVAPTQDYTITEVNIPAGWTLTDITCVNTGNNTITKDLANHRVVVHTADTLTGSDQGSSLCTFVNSKQASVTVDKVWKINGTDYPNSDPTVASLGLSAQLKIDGTDQGWGVARTGYLAGDTATLDETASSSNSLCTLSTGTVTLANGSPVDPAAGALPYGTGPLPGGSNSYTITNPVTCVAQVTLVKNVINGPALPSAWTLSANDGGAGADLSGATGTTGSIKADTVYTLSENNADARYDQVGPWTCTNGVSVTNSTINVGKGVSTTCTVSNATSKLTIIKHVVNNSGGNATASQFTVGFSPSGGSASTSGPGAEAPGTSYWVNPGTTYTVSESGGPAGYTGSTVCEGQVTNQVAPAADTEVTCTVTNDDNPGTLTLVKVLENGDSGSPYTKHDFTLTAAGPTPVSGPADSSSIVSQTVEAGDYNLSESGPAGYDASQWTCIGGTRTGSTVTVPLGGNVTCQITNTAVAPKLTLIKHVVNPDGSGGTAVATDWTLTATGPVTISGAGGQAATDVEVGTYTLTESTGPAGYSASDWTCSGGTQSTNHITLALKDVAICEITNTADQAELTLIKHVDHGTTGDTTDATAWTLTADGTAYDLSGNGGATGPVPAGTYALSETGPGAPAWAASAWTCTGGSQSGSNVTVALGQKVTCEITNTAQKPHLTLIKHVDNGNTGATHVATDWTLTATSGQNVVAGPGGASKDTPIGTYALTESGPAGYGASAWTCSKGLSGSTVTLALGDDITCEITNTAQPAMLTLVKVVDHGDTGDTTPATAWILNATGPQTISGPGGTSQGVPVGDYDLSETGPSTYSSGAWSCDKGLSGSTVSVALGDDITCTITNTAIPSQFRVTKSAVESDGVNDGFVKPGDTITYTVSVTKVGAGVPVLDINVTDDQTDLRDDAHLTSAIVTSAGAAAYDVNDPNLLKWSIPSLSNANTPVTMTYTFTVNDDAYGRHLRNVATAPGSLPCPENAPKCNETNQDTPHYILTKTAVESDGVNDGHVVPGDTVTYTLRVHNDSQAPVTGAVVTDDLTQVLTYADPATSAGDNVDWAAQLVGKTLTWNVPTIAVSGADATLVYTVKVKDYAWHASFDNVATPGPGGECPVPEDCTTHHVTPPVTTLVVKKVDFETGAALAGAHFVLWKDLGKIGTLEPGLDKSLGVQVTDKFGLARWTELLKGHYLIQETQPPPGYALPAVTVEEVDLTGPLFTRNFEADPWVFEDPSIGHLAIVAKQQYTRDASGDWVKRGNGFQADFGDRVKYIVKVEASGTKLFHQVTVTDWVPGFNPEDTRQFGTGSTMKASLVPGSAKCVGFACNVSVSPGNKVTWTAGTVKNAAFDVEMIVQFPEAPANPPFDNDGFFKASLWNVGFLAWDEAVANTPGSRALASRVAARAALPTVHHTLRSNAVLLVAQIQKPPPQLHPCIRHCLPNTGAAPYLLQVGALGGLVLVGGVALVARNRRREEAAE
jgi:uncharacterized repeat protein (TIGR01451 family)